MSSRKSLFNICLYCLFVRASLQDSPGTGLAQYPITNEQKKLVVPVI